MCNGLYRATIDTRSIDTHHETSDESSKSPGHDGVTSRYLPTGAHEVHPEGVKNVNFVTKSAPYTSSSLQLAGLDIMSIEPDHNTFD